MKYLMVFVFILVLFMIFGWVKPINDSRIWCYEKTVETLDEVSLGENERVMYTRGGIDIFKKCE